MKATKMHSYIGRIPIKPVIIPFKPPLTFTDLPVEIQDVILLKAAVTLRLSSGSYGEVFAGLAPVCTYWSEVLRGDLFHESVEQLAYLQDPMTRYLETAQPILVDGFQTENTTLICAVTLHDKLYTAEWSPIASIPTTMFTYDIDYTYVRHADPDQRKISFYNRQSLDITGLNGTIELLIPCSHADCLYVFERYDTRNLMTHRVKTDGTLVISWLLDNDLTCSCVKTISLNSSGMYLTFVCINIPSMAYVHDTSTGALVSIVRAGEENDYGLITVRVTERQGKYYDLLNLDNRSVDMVIYPFKDELLATSAQDDHGCVLRMSVSKIKLTNEGDDRELHGEIKPTTPRGSHWYDKGRGLVFYKEGAELMVLCVTH